MDYNGTKWNELGESMLSFCGQDKCSIDANGRIKFSPRFIADFTEHNGGDIVIHCLPEGALAVYPEDIYLQMRKAEPKPAEKAASSMVFRRVMRRFGAMTQSDKISTQGRITIPQMYRDYAELHPGTEVIVLGTEIGVEIWKAEKWQEEFGKINSHLREKGDREMAADLLFSKEDKEEI